MNYHFVPHASQELTDASLYYSKLEPSLGASFRAEIERAIALILLLPSAWPLLTKTARRCCMRRFPYGIVYRTHGHQVEILAVLTLA
jgi:hypothetical protein